ncbi:CTP synthase C-terminal region-related (seleno)protein [Aestuariispira ectoiniformans]|uniref:CTP synthase C-terminal region-related (seleno)protein n=1 Tax=Aestuariispira ectoiniformans TaxID=2775080 RepID=UPI00223B6E08|nr:CTP synthase [Aestuariispira ectoiniformans]
MSQSFRLALIGDYDASIPAHQALPLALDRAGRAVGHEIGHDWIETGGLVDPSAMLAGYGGVWVTPGSPYRNMDGVLAAIRFAREVEVPFLGTCGGFQHAVIEYLRNVLGQGEADHAESNPESSMPVIAPLVCSLVEKTGAIRFEAGSRLAEIFQGPTHEGYRCSYGLNEAYRPLLVESDMRFTGFDENGDVRAFELRAHPFFMGTLFQPERSALAGRDHPLITAFVQAIASR